MLEASRSSGAVVARFAGHVLPASDVEARAAALPEMARARLAAPEARKQLVEETGLYYFGGRYYDPVRARWASSDPALAVPVVLQPWLLSSYSYAKHNPLRIRDPDGRWPTEIHERIIDRAFPGLSPEQRAREWSGIPTTPREYRAARQNSAEEATISAGQMDTAVRAARDAFRETFGDQALQEAITPPKPAAPKKELR